MYARKHANLFMALDHILHIDVKEYNSPSNIINRNINGRVNHQHQSSVQCRYGQASGRENLKLDDQVADHFFGDRSLALYLKTVSSYTLRLCNEATARKNIYTD